MSAEEESVEPIKEESGAEKESEAIKEELEPIEDADHQDEELEPLEDIEPVKKRRRRRRKADDELQLEDKHCVLCEKVFSSNFRLQIHIRTVHEGLKEFVCDICGKGFSQKVCLKTHVKGIHEKSKEFSCHVCGKSFSHQSTQLFHIKTMHATSVESFTCHVCGKVFNHKKYLFQHIKNVHEKKTTRERSESPISNPLEKFLEIKFEQNNADATAKKKRKRSRPVKRKTTEPSEDRPSTGFENPDVHTSTSYNSTPGISMPFGYATQQPDPNWPERELRIYAGRFQQGRLTAEQWLPIQHQLLLRLQTVLEAVGYGNVGNFRVEQIYWNAQLGCGVINCLNHETMNWIAAIMESEFPNFRPWRSMKSTTTLVKIYIPKYLGHLTTEKFLELTLKLHSIFPSVPQMWNIENCIQLVDGRRVAMIMLDTSVFDTLTEGRSGHTWQVEGFGGMLTMSLPNAMLPMNQPGLATPNP